MKVVTDCGELKLVAVPKRQQLASVSKVHAKHAWVSLHFSTQPLSVDVTLHSSAAPAGVSPLRVAKATPSSPWCPLLWSSNTMLSLYDTEATGHMYPAGHGPSQVELARPAREPNHPAGQALHDADRAKA